MEKGEIVIERLTGRHVMLLEQVDNEWICRFADGRQENRRVFELAPSALARVVELTATIAGDLSIAFGRPQEWLAVPPPRFLQIVRGRRRRGTG